MIVPDFLPSEVHGTAPASSSGSTSAPSQPSSTDSPLQSDLAAIVEPALSDGGEDLYATALEVMERYLITRVLQETNGNQSKAAEILGITRGKIRDRVATFGITLDTNVGLDSSAEG